MSSNDQGLLILTDDNTKTTRSKSLIHAISEIEQFSVAEMNSELPEGSLPIAASLSFFEVGMKSGLLSGFITAIMTPLMMAASENLIPVFGEFEHTFFNRLFSIALTITFPVSYALFIFTSLTKSYAGNITKKAINNLVGGVSTGTIVKTCIVILLFHFLCFNTFDADAIVDKLSWIDSIGFISKLNLDYESVFDWIMKFRVLLIPSSYFIAFINTVFVIIVVFAVIIGRYRTKAKKEFLKEWE